MARDRVLGLLGLPGVRGGGGGPKLHPKYGPAYSVRILALKQKKKLVFIDTKQAILFLCGTSTSSTFFSKPQAEQPRSDIIH